jgi:hypothetical protein
MITENVVADDLYVDNVCHIFIVSKHIWLEHLFNSTRCSHFFLAYSPVHLFGNTHLLLLF